jgi:hypothetical protein
MLEWWGRCVAPENVLLAYGGTETDFQALVHPQKFFVNDPRLRTRDHQRELQSYTAIFREASEWLRGRPYEFVHFCEYDQVPLAADFNRRQVDRMDAEKADVLGYRVLRVDGTSHPHYLYHASNPRFHEFLRSVSCRKDPGVVLSMFGTGSVWRREAFDDVARLEEPFPIYLELYLPTLAHHLGFRVRPLPDQDRFVHHLGDMSGKMDEAREARAWAIHPVKGLWNR